MAKQKGKRPFPSGGPTRPAGRRRGRQYDAPDLTASRGYGKSSRSFGNRDRRNFCRWRRRQMVMTGHQRLQSVNIAPDILTPDDVEMLQDLILAAVNEAIERSQQLTSERMGSLTGGLNLPGLF